MTDHPSLTRLARRMRRKGATLCFGYGPNGGRQWWLEPGQRPFSDEAARNAIESGSVLANDTGLFGNQPQSYRVAP